MNLILQKNNKYFFMIRFSTIVYITSKFNFAKNEYKNLVVILLTLNESKNVGYWADFELVLLLLLWSLLLLLLRKEIYCKWLKTKKKQK